MHLPSALLDAANRLSNTVSRLSFSEPVSYVYNPLEYAWEGHRQYLERFADRQKRVVFMGMNPGPWGMSQTGVPFGEVNLVRDWMGIQAAIGKPQKEHPKRQILGFECDKSEVSGRRLWGLFSSRFPKSKDFFQDHLVINYCPLVFMEESSRNRTPDKLPGLETSALFEACNQHLRTCIEALNPEWIVGVGGFAQSKARDCLSDFGIRHGKMLHPSPASPAANRGWAEAASKQLLAQGIWKE